MAETHVISALVAKRSELAGLVDHHRKEVIRLLQDVKLLGATIRLFEPEFSTDLMKPKRHHKKNVFFQHGEGGSAVLDYRPTTMIWALNPSSCLSVSGGYGRIAHDSLWRVI